GTCSDPALERYRREIFLCEVSVSVGRRLPANQRRTAHTISACLLSFAKIVRFGIPPDTGDSERTAREFQLQGTEQDWVLQFEVPLRPSTQPRDGVSLVLLSFCVGVSSSFDEIQ